VENQYINIERLTRGADESLVRPGRKQATTTKLSSARYSKKFRTLSVQPGLPGSHDLRVGRKMVTFQLFFQSGRAKDLSTPCTCFGQTFFYQISEFFNPEYDYIFGRKM